MTTDNQIQVIPAAIFNGTITKLEKRIAASWGQLERAVQSKDIVATRAAVNRVAHLESLRLKHVALEQTIVDTISNPSASQTAPVPDSISNSSPAEPAPTLERGSVNLFIQTAPVPGTGSNGLPAHTPVLETRSDGSSTLIAPVSESVFSGPISQIAPVLESISNGSPAHTAPVLETRFDGPTIQTAPIQSAPIQSAPVQSPPTQPAPVLENSNSSSVQPAPAPAPSQVAPVPSQPAPVPEKAAEPQPEVQSPVARPKRKPVRPVEIKFGSVKKHIRYATEIPVAIANWLIEQGKELPITANFIHPSDAGFSQSATTKKLKSGQFMRVGHNQEALLHKARELLDGCGYEGVQIKVLLDNGITLSA
jgi:hypothetical protein